MTITCLECDHEHKVTVIRGEYPQDDYVDGPENCESCGADLAGGPYDDRAAERKQMGITD